MIVIPIVVSALWTVHKDLERRPEELEIGGRIVALQTSVLLRLARRDLRKLAVTQTPVNDHQLKTGVKKTQKK